MSVERLIVKILAGPTGKVRAMYKEKMPSWVVGLDRRTILSSLYIGSMITWVSGFNLFWADPLTLVNPDFLRLENFILLFLQNIAGTAAFIKSYQWARAGFYWQAAIGISAIFFFIFFAALWVPGRQLIV